MLLLWTGGVHVSSMQYALISYDLQLILALMGVTPAPAAPPIRYLEGHCLAYGSAIPYLPVLDLLRACCGIAPSDSPVVMAEKVRLGLQTAGLDPDEGGLYLLPLLGGHTETDRMASLSPE